MLKDGKVALITGASSGFGLAITEKLLSDGYCVYGIARRKNKLNELAHKYDQFIPIPLDITDEKAVNNFFKKLTKEKKQIYLLVNNAGLALDAKKYGEMLWEDIQQMIHTNIFGLAHITWSFLRLTRNQDAKYIINVGSIAGSYAYPNNNIYGASKAFVNHFSENLRSDYYGKKVRVTNIEPGLAKTEFSKVRFKGNVNKEKDLYENSLYIKPKDIASIVDYLLKLPPHININRIEIMPEGQAWGPLLISRSLP
jgi:3-hydroxy acid dehydrogenase / malonic semialdehyde reductase